MQQQNVSCLGYVGTGCKTGSTQKKNPASEDLENQSYNGMMVSADLSSCNEHYRRLSVRLGIIWSVKRAAHNTAVKAAHNTAVKCELSKIKANEFARLSP